MYKFQECVYIGTQKKTVCRNSHLTGKKSFYRSFFSFTLNQGD